MKKWGVMIAGLLLVGLGVYWLTRPESVGVVLVPVERGNVERKVANTRAGTIEACQRSKLSLPIGGQIDRLLVVEGDRVERGQLLVALWNKDRQARVEEAQAALNSAVRERESRCIGARSDVREADRLSGLADRQLVSQESADLARARAEASMAACEATRAREEQSGASLKLARASYEQTELRAPFDGIVAEVTGKIGEYATPSPPGVPTPPAIDLITDDCHYVSAPLDEVDAAGVAVGLPVEVSLDAFRGRTFAAAVSRLAPYVLDLEKQARTVEVEAEFVDLDPHIRLLAGYSADVEIILETRENALRIPTELIIDNAYVLVVGAGGHLERRQITMGIANWRYTEVTAGLVAGESIVANIGAAGVEAGVTAQVLPGDADAAD